MFGWLKRAAHTTKNYVVYGAKQTPSLLVKGVDMFGPAVLSGLSFKCLMELYAESDVFTGDWYQYPYIILPWLIGAAGVTLRYQQRYPRVARVWKNCVEESIYIACFVTAMECYIFTGVDELLDLTTRGQDGNQDAVIDYRTGVIIFNGMVLVGGIFGLLTAINAMAQDVPFDQERAPLLADSHHRRCSVKGLLTGPTWRKVLKGVEVGAVSSFPLYFLFKLIPYESFGGKLAITLVRDGTTLVCCVIGGLLQHRYEWRQKETHKGAYSMLGSPAEGWPDKAVALIFPCVDILGFASDFSPFIELPRNDAFQIVDRVAWGALLAATMGVWFFTRKKGLQAAVVRRYSRLGDQNPNAFFGPTQSSMKDLSEEAARQAVAWRRDSGVMEDGGSAIAAEPPAHSIQSNP